MDKEKYVGMTKLMNNGREATIIAFRDFYDIDVRLDTGEIATNKEYYDFNAGNARELGFYCKPVQNKPANPPAISKDSVQTAYLYNYLSDGKEKAPWGRR